MARHSTAQRRWVFAPRSSDEAEIRALSDGLKISDISARILHRRGFATPERAEAFLSRRMDLLHDPATLPDIAKAVARIAEAVEKKQRIVLFGDYDADGVTATALLARFFEFLSSRPQTRVTCDAMVPERKNGYGLAAQAVKDILAKNPALLITLDNGISAVDAIDALNAAGVDCIVVDHHLPGDVLPRAIAVINPKRTDAGNAYPFSELCGAGVTFKLVWALAVHYSQNKMVAPEFRTFLIEAMALAAIGTVADVVPLVDENRVLVHHGLKLLLMTKQPGLRALLEISRLLPDPTDKAAKEKTSISPGDVGFRLGPRINAAGRCGSATDALELLMTASPARATELAQKLEAFNSERQKIEEGIIADARAQAQSTLAARPHCRGFVLASDTWHQGVIGIAASRIVEEFYRPALLLAINKDTGVAHGSGRSIKNFNLHEAMHHASEHLVTFGGHAAAAGLTIRAEHIDAFRTQFEASVFERLGEDDLVPRIHLDSQIDMAQLTPKLCTEMELFEPCGMGNPRPTLAVCGAELPAPPRLMGRDEKHVQFFARQGTASRRVIAFNYAEHFNTLCDCTQRRTLDLAFRPQINTFRGETNVELMLEAFRISNPE
ncbi:MAG: single-stranded-DNA-specific exonuclease RecJ [Planctomycetota bacterium]